MAVANHAQMSILSKLQSKGHDCAGVQAKNEQEVIYWPSAPQHQVKLSFSYDGLGCNG